MPILDTAETFNQHAIAARGDKIVSLRMGVIFTIPEACNLAAWLVVMSGVPREEFLQLLDAIEST